MASTTITDLNELVTPDDSDVFPIVDIAGDETKKITMANIAANAVADNSIAEVKLKLDEAPTNDFVLTADDGKSGGMKWSEAASGAMVLIHEEVLTETGQFATATITTTNYNSLIIELAVKSSAATEDDIYITFNGDTGSNYFTQFTKNGGGNSTSGTTTSFSLENTMDSDKGNDNQMRVEVSNSANFQKWCRAKSQLGNAINGEVRFKGVWKNNAKITSVDVVGQVNLTTDSELRIYGVI